MDSKTFKKIARLLKEAWKELEVDALKSGIDIFGEEYKSVQDKIRIKILEKFGYTLEEYQAAKELVSPTKKVEEAIDEVTQSVANLDIPTIEKMEEIAQKYVVPPVVTNQIVEKTTETKIVEKPTIVKETVIQNNITKEEYNDGYIMAQLGYLQDRVDQIKIAEPIDIPKLKEELNNDFAIFFEKNINTLGMPDFRKLAMGLQAQIDEKGSGGASAYADLADVNMTGLADGNMPVWDDTTGKWIPGTPTDTDEKVKLNASDPTAGYLDDKITGYGFLTDISGQDLSTADNSTSQFITIGDVPAETDPLSLHLDQTTGQALTNVTDVTITASDEIYYGDVTDSNKIKKDTVQGILDLVPATDLTPYAKLDGTNQPFTGNLNVSKVDPEVRITDTGNSSYARLLKSDTLNNAYQYNKVVQPAATNYAVGFTGPNNWISFGTDFWNASGNFSCQLWFKASAAPASGVGTYIIGMDDAVGWHECAIVLGQTGTVAFLTYESGYGSTAPSSNICDGNWHHIVITKSGTDGVLYVDNTAYTGTVKNVTGLTARRWGFRFGAGYCANGTYYDEVAIWNRALSASEVSALYNGGSGLYGDTSVAPFNSGLTYAWHCNEGTSTSVACWQGTNTGTLTAGGTWGEGKTTSSSTAPVETVIWSSTDGSLANEKGIQTYGDISGRTILEGKSLRFNIAGTEKATITSDGDFGLGVTSPTEKFELQDTTCRIVLKSTTGVANAGFRLSNTTDDKAVLIQYKNIGGLVFSTGQNAAGTGGGDYLQINHDGEVSIKKDLIVGAEGQLSFGAANDAYIGFDGDSLNIVANSVTGTDSLELTAGTFKFLTGNIQVVTGNDIRPASNSTTAINIAQADGTDWVIFDTTNKRVRIGSTGAPNATRLDLIGAGTTTGVTLRTAGSDGTERFSVLDNGVTTITPTAAALGQSTMAAGMAFNTSLGTAASSVFTIAGSANNLFTTDPTNNRIGVRTATPAANLDVVGTVRMGDSATNYTAISATGDQTFAGSAGFYPRRIRQDDAPATGTGATQIDTGELVMWCDSNDSDKVYLVYNDTTKGIVKVELT